MCSELSDAYYNIQVNHSQITQHNPLFHCLHLTSLLFTPRVLHFSALVPDCVAFLFLFLFLSTERIDERYIKAPIVASKCHRPLQRLRGCFLGDNAAVPPAYRVKVQKCASFVDILDVCKFTTFCDRKGYTRLPNNDRRAIGVSLLCACSGKTRVRLAFP